MLLPRAAAAMRRHDHMLTLVESGRTLATGLSSGRILVVDDDPAVRHLISDYFGEQGIQTVSATGRSAAARQLAGEDPSAIILELGQGNGLDLLREIRSSSDVPVITPALRLPVPDRFAGARLTMRLEDFILDFLVAIWPSLGVNDSVMCCHRHK